ncbi:MAG TPA: DUF1326 domain-containing protein [Solirubrobacteraceae bacterium]|nr:DUF1326 domain-containing protein [Solirubrobacteraceae bacterium]
MSPSTQSETSAPPTGYRVAGRFLEACDCYAICPCWIDEVPDDDRCTGIYVWDISTGDAQGHGLDGLRVASVSYHQGKRRSTRQTVVLLIDERASDGQREVLADIFSGRSGGPLAELAEMLGRVAGQRTAKIDITWDGVKAKLNIEGKVRVSTRPKIGPSGRVTTLVDPAIADSFGSPAHVSLSDKFVVDLEDLDEKIEVTGRSATTGWFAYTA